MIVDLDALVDSEKVADIAEALTGASSDMHDLIEKQRDLAEGIRNQPPTFTESDARERLEQLSRQKLDWRNGDDNLLRRQLAELSGIVKRVRRLKEGGVSAYKDDPEIYSLLNEVVDGFAQVGLFFVPVGQLEDWVVQLMADVPKRGTSKTDRAAIAADCIRAATDNSGDVWAFTRRVLDYLRAARK
ncbi:MAG: hypothetical protein DWQ37_05655 [Planctomycetota bacterium]|nr:MAG: hypothetical protein DWQ37_05655 [Planctomycetota bacterium]